LFAILLTTACSQVKPVQIGPSTLSEVATVNPKPNVVWNTQPNSNKIFNSHNTQFMIPDQYFKADTTDFDIGASGFAKHIYFNLPDLKPLSNEKRLCQDQGIGTLNCFMNVLEIQGGHNLNRQVFKDDGINENNYLNYPFDKSRGGGDSGIFLNNPTFTVSSEYNLTAYLSVEDKPIDEKTPMAGDNYFLKDEFENVLTSIRCTNRKLDREYKAFGLFDFPTCVHQIVVKKHKMVLFIIYERKYLPQWQQIQSSVEILVNQFNQAAIAKQGDK
jgi:hypothetical protein